MPNNLKEPFDSFKESVGLSTGELAGCAIAIVAAVVLLIVVWKRLRGRKRELPEQPPDLTIDVATLGTAGPPPDPPILEYYNVPVRLAAVVLAPTGRTGTLPPGDELAELIDHMVPGLAKVFSAHRPLTRRWPPQLSAQGFTHAFFAHVKLPGEGGKETPWCAVAGRFRIHGQSVMAGLVMRAEEDNNFGQSVVEEEHQWLGILRVKRGG